MCAWALRATSASNGHSCAKCRPTSRSWKKPYDEWLQNCEASIRDLRRSGLRIERVTVDVHELAAWCRAKGQRLDGEARAAFASEKLMERHRVPPAE